MSDDEEDFNLFNDNYLINKLVDYTVILSDKQLLNNFNMLINSKKEIS